MSGKTMWLFLVMVLACGGAAACSSTKDAEGSGNNSGNRDGGDDSDDDDDEGGSGSTGSGSGNDPDDVDDGPVGDDLVLLFNPMHSAYDGEHEYKIPAIVQGVQDVEWSARPADSVYLTPDSSFGGVMITTRAAGDVVIIARAGQLSGSAILHITDATPDDWALGEMRYNNDIPFPEFDVPDGGFDLDGGFPDGGFDAGGFEVPDNLSCRNCHGASAMALDVEHTPQQTGGYSDDELIKIFTIGIKPADAKFHTPFPDVDLRALPHLGRRRGREEGHRRLPAFARAEDAGHARLHGPA